MLTLRIITPLEDLFDGEIVSLSSRNSVGNFDILSGHAHFITLIQDDPIIVRLTSGERKEFKFPIAVISCDKDIINVYTDLSRIELILPEPKPFI